MRKVILLLCAMVLCFSGKALADNYALQFDSVNDYVDIQDSSSLDLTSGLTIEAWVKPSVVTSWNVIVSKWVGPTPNAYLFKIESSRLYFAVDVSGAVSIITGNTIIPTDTWTHVAATYDSSIGMKLFVNGVEDGIYPRTGNISTNNQNLTIGCINGVGQVFNGVIDEVRIWNYARISEQLQAWMNYYLSGTEPGLVAYWKLDEGSGQIAYDSTQNANNGQLGSTPNTDPNDPQWIVSTSPIVIPGVPPVAEAGPNQRAGANQTITLDGSASYDPDGTIVNYQWKRLPNYFGNYDVIYSGPNATCETKALGRVEELIQLTVTDNEGGTGTDTMHIYWNRPVQNNDSEVAQETPADSQEQSSESQIQEVTK